MTYPVGGLPPLVTVEQLEHALRVAPGTLDLDQATQAILSASGAVRDVCGWRIDYEEVTDFPVKLKGGRVLFLPTAHLVSVDSVKLDSEVLDPYIPGSVDTLYDYIILWEAAALRSHYTFLWPVTQGRVQVSFSHGYDLDPDESPSGHAPPIPPGIKNVVLAVAARSMENLIGHGSLKVGQVSQTFTPGTPGPFVVSKSESHQLAPHKLWNE